MARKHSPLRIIPLGGLDGIGKNMTAFVSGGDMIVVDVGIMFPDDSQLGVDLVLPDYTYVLEHEDRLRGIIITHGHEDHTGGIPYLLTDLNRSTTIYGSKLTLGIIQGKLDEHRLGTQRLQQIRDGSHIQLGCSHIDFFSMTHSIPGAMGLFIQTPQGNVLHTGDFKLDQTPIDGITPNYQAICRYASKGIDLLMSDSTNASTPGFTRSEAAVGASLRHVIKNAPGRVFVACFSSHIHRLQQVCDASVAVGRKVVVTGRSMITNTRIARELGYLNVADDDIIDAYKIDKLPDNKIVVMCTGSQGEPLSALGRMSTGDHKSLSIGSNDTVIISATPVPGNERSVQSIINTLSKLGCTVVDKRENLVHVSGHASQEELKLMLAMTKPKNFMPVHGEAMHLRAHAQLAQEMGMNPKRVFVVDNGETLEMRHGKVRMGEPVDSGIIFVDGSQIGEARPSVMRERKRLAQDGVVACLVIVSAKTAKVQAVDLSWRGVSFGDDDDLENGAKTAVRNSVNNAQGAAHTSGKVSNDALRRTVRNSLSNYLWHNTHTRPVIISTILEV